MILLGYKNLAIKSGTLELASPTEKESIFLTRSNRRERQAKKCQISVTTFMNNPLVSIENWPIENESLGAKFIEQLT